MLSLLEQSHDLPEQHFLSVAMFYNDSSEAQSFQASADFLTVPEDGTDLEELHPGHAPSAPFLSHTLPPLCDLTVLLHRLFPLRYTLTARHRLKLRHVYRHQEWPLRFCPLSAQAITRCMQQLSLLL